MIKTKLHIFHYILKLNIRRFKTEENSYNSTIFLISFLIYSLFMTGALSDTLAENRPTDTKTFAEKLCTGLSQNTMNTIAAALHVNPSTMNYTDTMKDYDQMNASDCQAALAIAPKPQELPKVPAQVMPVPHYHQVLGQHAYQPCQANPANQTNHNQQYFGTLGDRDR